MLAATALLAGCAPTAPTAPTLPDGVEIGLIQLRSDVAAGQAQVRIVNDSDETFDIGAVELVDPRFADAAGRADPGRVTTVRAGATVDIRVQLPAMACDVSDGEPVARLELAASVSVVEAPVDDLLGIIAPLHERECRSERLAQAAHVAWGAFHPAPAGEPGVLDLEVQPTGDAEAVLVGVRPTNLLMFPGTAAASGSHVLDLTVDGGAPIVVPIELVPLRCDPHAVQEDKRGTIFTLDVELDGIAGEIELAADEDLRAELLAWVSAWCA